VLAASLLFHECVLRQFIFLPLFHLPALLLFNHLTSPSWSTHSICEQKVKSNSLRFLTRCFTAPHDTSQDGLRHLASEGNVSAHLLHIKSPVRFNQTHKQRHSSKGKRLVRMTSLEVQA